MYPPPNLRYIPAVASAGFFNMTGNGILRKIMGHDLTSYNAAGFHCISTFSG
jgi:hypothetical protein